MYKRDIDRQTGHFVRRSENIATYAVSTVVDGKKYTNEILPFIIIIDKALYCLIWRLYFYTSFTYYLSIKIGQSCRKSPIICPHLKFYIHLCLGSQQAGIHGNVL